MIKLFRIILVLVLMFTITSIIPVSVNAQAAPVPPLQPGTTQPVACYNFASDFSYGMDIPPARIAQYRNTVANPAYAQYIAAISKLHEILGAEGYPVQSSEEKNKKFGKATAIAMVKYQIANKTAIGEDPSGIFSEKTRSVINQKYGCIAKATIDLTAPNTNTIAAKGEIMTIKWTAAKIPNTTDLTIQYVRDNNTATTTIATQSNIRNGSGQYNWTIPTTMTPGNYKVLVSLTGASKSDVSAKTFEVKEKALEIIKPDTLPLVSAGGKLPITWKTSTAIKPADKIKINLVGTLISDGSVPLNLEIARVANNGAYTWTVPDRINGRIVTSTSTFKIVLQTENGLHTSTSSTSIEIAPVRTTVVGTISITQPVAGAQYLAAQTIPVKWTSTGFKATDDVQISLVANTGTLTNGTTIATVKNNGTYNWVVPTSIGSTLLATTTLNQYKIVVSSLANTSVRATSSNFSITPTQAQLAPKITIGTVPTSIERGVPHTLTWTSNSTVTAAGKVKVELVDINRGTVAETLTTNVVANANTVSVTIPAKVLATATSSHRFRIVPTAGLTNFNSAGSESTSFRITARNASITASTTIAAADAGIAYRGASMTLSVRGTNIPNNTAASLFLVPTTGVATVVTTSAKINNGILDFAYVVPKTLATSSYRLIARATVDGQQLEAFTPTFEVRERPVTAPKITVSNVTGSVPRGASVIVNWTTNGAFPSTAKVVAKVVRINGSVETAVVSSPSVVASSNTTTVTIPANATASPISPTATAKDYKIVLLVTGLTTGTSLDATSDVNTDTFSVLTQGANGILTAQTNIATADAGVVFRGSPLLISATTTDAVNNTAITAKLVGATGQTTNVAVSATGKIISNAATLTLNIPTTLAVGTYKVQVNTSIDTRPLEAFTTTFEVRDRPVILPKITIGTVPASIERGVPYTLTWTSNSTVTAAAKVRIELVNISTGLVDNVFIASVAANKNSEPVTIPVKMLPTPNASHRIRIVPLTGLTLDPTSVLLSTDFKINSRSGELTTTFDKSTVIKGNPIVINLAGTVPSTAKVTATLVFANQSPIVGVPAVTANFSAGKITFPIHPSIPAGQYKFYLSTVVDINPVNTYSAEFTVVNPNPVFTMVGTPTISKASAATGKTTTMTATFDYSAKANGAALAKILPANVSVVFEDTATGSTTPASTVTVTSAAVANGATANNQKVVAIMNAASLPLSANFKAKIQSVAWTMGTTPNLTTGTETAAFATFVTPSVAFVK